MKPRPGPPEHPPSAMPPTDVLPENVISGISLVLAGVTEKYAATVAGCELWELRDGLKHPEAKRVPAVNTWDAVQLLDAEFRETPDILAGVIPVGVTLISAAPKVGKTRWLMQLSVAAVRGEAFLGLPVTQTGTLALALEDGARRYRKALDSLTWGNRPLPGQLTIRTAINRLDEGGIDDIERHLDKRPGCKLVIIDVLARVRPRGIGSDKYRLDYEALAPLQRMANLRQVAVIVVHHANQRADVTDIFEKMSGTSGLIGVVDSLMLLERRRGDDIGLLHVSGREVEDQEIALSFVNGWWGTAPQGMPSELLKERREIRELWLWLADNDGADTDEIAKQYGRTKDATLKVVRRLEEQELVDSTGAPTKGRSVRWQVVRRG